MSSYVIDTTVDVYGSYTKSSQQVLRANEKNKNNKKRRYKLAVALVVPTYFGDHILAKSALAGTQN